MEPESVIFNGVNLKEVSKIINILTNINEFLLIRLFENPFSKRQTHFGVWLCVNYKWRCIIVDDSYEVH